MKIAVVGLAQSGKSMLVSAISGKQATPVGSAHIQETIVQVPDERLDWLTELYRPTKTVHATIDCLDMPALSFIDHHGQAAARRLFSQIRTVELLIIVVRAFENSAIGAYRNRIDPAADLAELRTELFLADLELVTTRIERLRKQLGKPSKTQTHDKAELDLQLKLQDTLESEKPISSVVSAPGELDMVKSLGFLTLKPVIIVVNVGEDQMSRSFDLAAGEDIQVITLCAKLESELSQLDADSRREFMKDLGLAEPAAKRFVRSCYDALGLVSFLTHGKDEVRAWAVKRGTSAVEAAGKVHTDIQRGFIRAETTAFSDLKQFGDEKKVKATGKMRLEGKNYIVQDGDIICFRFNV